MLIIQLREYELKPYFHWQLFFLSDDVTRLIATEEMLKPAQMASKTRGAAQRRGVPLANVC